jgi:hypothetical protein
MVVFGDSTSAGTSNDHGEESNAACLGQPITMETTQGQSAVHQLRYHSGPRAPRLQRNANEAQSVSIRDQPHRCRLSVPFFRRFIKLNTMVSGNLAKSGEKTAKAAIIGWSISGKTCGNISRAIGFQLPDQEMRTAEEKKEKLTVDGSW